MTAGSLRCCLPFYGKRFISFRIGYFLNCNDNINWWLGLSMKSLDYSHTNSGDG